MTNCQRRNSLSLQFSNKRYQILVIMQNLNDADKKTQYKDI